ncbi:MAG: hypothetical protein D6712_19145 [Chloroflexi bacterium]|nr:MAG: hypothetical protein D6712_19145 [Chloroflexota bacterium]
MIKQSDIEGRLRLFRYGIVVVVVVTFLVSFITPIVALNAALGSAAPPATQHLGTAIIFTVVAAIVGAAAYFAYSAILQRSMQNQSAEQQSGED